MTTDTKAPVVAAEVEDYSPETKPAAIVETSSSPGFMTYGSHQQPRLNLVRIGKPKSVEANHPWVENCCFWRYPTGDQPLYMPFRYPNGKPQNTLADLQLVAIEETIVSYASSPESAKLNLTVTNDLDSTAEDITLTCGLASNFGISVLQGLVTLVNNHPALTPFNLSAKGEDTQRGKTHYAYIYVGKDWLKNDDLFKEFRDIKTEFYNSELAESGAQINRYKPLLSKCRELVAQISAALPSA